MRFRPTFDALESKLLLDATPFDNPPPIIAAPAEPLPPVDPSIPAGQVPGPPPVGSFPPPDPGIV